MRHHVVKFQLHVGNEESFDALRAREEFRVVREVRKLHMLLVVALLGESLVASAARV